MKQQMQQQAQIQQEGNLAVMVMMSGGGDVPSNDIVTHLLSNNAVEERNYDNVEERNTDNVEKKKY